MLTLEQVRAVNDGLKNGDLHAALRPLEETIDLRHAELPRLEKSALAALKSGLISPENARFWAESLFHPNVSVRRFARKSLLGLKSDAAPIAAPLRARLETFWAEETPLPETFNSREAAQRREQREIVQSAVEVLLRADSDAFMALYQAVLDAPTPLDDVASEWRGWETKQQAYSQAVQRKQDEIFRAEWGEEFASDEKRYQLPWRIWREIGERVQSDPEVQKLLADLGESPWQRAAQGWNPLAFFQAALSGVLQADATGPQQEIATKVRPYLWRWIEVAFDEKLPASEKSRAAARVHRALGHYWQWVSLDTDEFWARVPKLLTESKERLRGEIEAATRRGYVYNQTPGALWVHLASALGQSCHKPYNVKGDWRVAENITPELLRDLNDVCKAEYLNAVLQRAAAQLEKDRATKPQVAASPVAPPQTTITVGDNRALAFDWADFESGNVELALDDEGNYVAVKIADDGAPNPENANVILQGEAEETFIADAEKVVQLILNGHAMMKPISYARAWKKKLGEAPLKERLWPRVGPLLWTHYEAKLQEYRRVESEEPTGKIAEKLTERELKSWKAQKRREKRMKVEEQLDHIAATLRDIEGVEAEERLLKLLQRPGFSEAAERYANTLLPRIANIPYRQASAQGHLIPALWWRENWFLDAKWESVIEQAEKILLKAKRQNEWQRAYLVSQLAVAYYRLNTAESRAKFRESLSQIEHAPHGLSLPVVALGDVETWLLLLEKMQWPDATLKELWTKTRQTPESDDARRLTEKVLQLAATTSHERGAKFILEMLGDVSADELSAHAQTLVAALESSLIPVKRWALKALSSLDDYDRENAATLAGEMLWNENGALVKDAAKFLGAQSGDAALIAWEALQDAASLENVPILEAIFRALAALRSKNKTLQLGETPREKLAQLRELSPERFAKFEKKLLP